MRQSEVGAGSFESLVQEELWLRREGCPGATLVQEELRSRREGCPGAALVIAGQVKYEKE